MTSQRLDRPHWLTTLRRFALFTLLGHLLWEVAHIPLYTIWVEGTWGEIVFAVVHCTGGDLLIAMSSLLLALFFFGTGAWPQARIYPVFGAMLAIGLGYTIFSEWLNIEVREAWAYRDIMPVIPFIDAGLTPMLQWLIVPFAAYFGALRRLSKGKGATGV
ncbi:MAG: hypothetical protein ACU0CJ_06035 [Sulfitobacter sp.]|jgi:hypothetical protein|uniref:hypothetical protein n=1 Tax=unclassified Sulfitobacter TaxID=196795 RepID=UPI0007C35AB9|nr:MULTISPECIES: hypothetical protein [unclassified Sulfitobacter]KZY00149.1 hypothetical protein A3720_11150 [Sulfitobacter sp. HI0021]KZY04385.1 hypothetical protein A3722_19365 [Sulfitobacter sp. HI0027]KZZ01480.1 hypothetical protein A3747_18950 [Sulfitobacter sp. HI0076]